MSIALVPNPHIEAAAGVSMGGGSIWKLACMMGGEMQSDKSPRAQHWEESDDRSLTCQLLPHYRPLLASKRANRATVDFRYARTEQDPEPGKSRHIK